MEAADNMLHGDSDEEEYVPDTLSHRLELGGRLEPEKVLELAFTLLDALEQLAEHDLAHRDIKPANIVFINGQAKLSDIGLISATGVRSKVVGTVDFMPPESSDGDPVEYGRDLYALGKVLYCALTGLLPENYPEVPLTVPLRAWRQFKNVLLRACSPDPRQRFYTPEAFRKALPHEIHATTFVDESMEHVRTYRKQHPVAWRLSIISVILIFAALLLSSFLALHMRQEFRQIQQQRKNFIFRTIDLLNDRSLQLQRIAAGSGNTARSWQLQSIAELASNTRADGDWEATERYCRIADAHLRVWAGEEFRLLQEKYPLEPLPLNHNKLQKMLEAYSNFQSTVLAEYLPESLRIQLQNSIEQMQQKLSDLWHGPILGSNWHSPLTGNMQFIYIPAGKLPGEPTDSFWMSSSEATCELFNRLRPGSGRKFLPPNLPVTNISWNDRLELCRLLTLQAKKMRILPDGYIFRLPYANEWNFVLQGAWQSAAHFIHEQQSVDSYAWYGANSMYQVHEVSTKAPGLMGFYDMIGNVAESVLMRPTLPGKQPQAGNFGASFRNRRVSSEINHTTSIDMLENNWSGFRLVLGRGTMDYFDHNWYLGEKRQIRQQDHIYELLGSPACRWNGELALAWCKMLDVEPLMMPEKTLRKKLYNAHERVRELPTLLGAFYKNAQWMWLSGVPLNYGEWLIHNNEGNTAEQGEYLVWDHGFWRSIDKTAACTGRFQLIAVPLLGGQQTQYGFFHQKTSLGYIFQSIAHFFDRCKPPSVYKSQFHLPANHPPRGLVEPHLAECPLLYGGNDSGNLPLKGRGANKVAAGTQGLHGRLIMVGGILKAAGADTGDIGLEFTQHGLGIRVTGHAELFRCGSRPFRIAVTDTDQIYVGVVRIGTGMAVSDMPHANNTGTQHIY